MGGRGGRRPGAGRKKGSLNKSTIARAAAAEILGVEDDDLLDRAVHRRGHTLLMEMERLALDPTQPPGLRIMAAKTALPFLIPRQEAAAESDVVRHDLIEALEQGRRRVLAARDP